MFANMEKDLKRSYEVLIERHYELYNQICADDRAAQKAFAYQRKDLDGRDMNLIAHYTTLLGERCDILSQYIKARKSQSNIEGAE